MLPLSLDVASSRLILLHLVQANGKLSWLMMMTKHVHCTSRGTKVKATGLSKCCKPRLHNDSRSNKNVNERMEERKIADESNDLGSCGGDGEGKRRNGKSGLLSRLEQRSPSRQKGNGIIFCHIHDPREKVRAKATIFSFRNSGRRLPPPSTKTTSLRLLLPPPLAPLPSSLRYPLLSVRVCMFLRLHARLVGSIDILSSPVARLSSTMDLSW